MDQGVLTRLQGLLRPDQVSLTEAARRPFCRDEWVLSQLDEMEPSQLGLPLAVLHPETTDDVVRVVNECRQSGAELVPAGLRSGVCGGLRADEQSLVLDMSRLNRVLSIDAQDHIGCFEAGVRGSDAQEAAVRHGLTLGHFPQSIAISSVGGWVATRAAGQFSTGYGSIEDRLMDLEAVLPNGEVLATRNAPRSATGLDLRELMLGSEGTLGVITRVQLQLDPAPEARSLAAFHFSTMSEGLEAQRRVLQAGWNPAVMRLYDHKEVTRHFPDHREGEKCLLLVVHEGPLERVEAERVVAERLLCAHGAQATNASATERWLRERNQVRSVRGLLERGVVVDTIEVAAPWSRVMGVYEAAIEALSGMRGIWNGSAHSSHAYKSGVNLYFTFAVQREDRRSLQEAYWEAWRCVMDATLGSGGVIAHHHGVGRVRTAYLERALGPTALKTLRAVKQAIDPTGFLNPGVLLPQPSPAARMQQLD